MRGSIPLLVVLLLLSVTWPRASPANQGLIVRDQSMGAGRGLAVGPGPDSGNFHADYLIELEMGTARGENLFHSFDQFSIGQGEVATFNNLSGSIGDPNRAAIAFNRIITRVTGGSISQIDGLMRSRVSKANGSGADLILLNSNGVVIGSQGVFDLPGSLFLSSAAGLVFEDGVFDTSSQDSPFVFSSPAVECCGGEPTALSFGSGPRGDIEFNGGTHRWTDGSMIQVAGGNVRLLSGTKLLAPGSEVHLAAVGQAAVEVPLAFVADADLSGVSTGSGTVELRGVPGTGTATTDLTVNGGADSNGRVVLRGGHLELAGAKITAGGRDGSQTAIDLVAQDSILMSDSKIQGLGTAEVSEPSHRGIRVMAPDIFLDPGSDVHSASSETSAGSIEFIAQDHLRLVGEVGKRTAIHTRLLNDDAGGGIRIVAGAVALQDGAKIYSEAFPKFGFSPSGPGGKIQVDADRVSLEAGAVIYTTTEAASASGAIALTVSDSLQLSNLSQIYTQAGNPLSGGGAVAETGPAGNVEISAGTVVLEGASSIRSTTHTTGTSGDVVLGVDGVLSLSDASQVYTEASGSTAAMTGRAGNLDIVAEDIALIDGSNVRSTTLTAGRTGDVYVTAQGALTLSDLSGIATQPKGSGDAGTIVVNAGSAILDQGGTIISEAAMEQGAPGAVTVVVAGLFRVSGVGVNSNGLNSQSLISTRVVNSDSESDAGDISIRAGSLELIDGGLISARTKTAPGSGFGNAGDIVIAVDSLLRVSGEHVLPGPDGVGFSSEISARGAGGAGGQIDITASTVEISDTGRISASNFGESNSGSVSVDAVDTISMVNGTIFTESGRREGGNITLDAGNLISLVDSALETEVSSSQGGAGEINLGQITEPRQIVLNSSSLISNAAAGEAGDITISAGYLIKSADTVIDAASDNASLNGTIRIDALEQDLSGRLVPLELAYLDVSSLLLPPCAARVDADRSSLIVGRRPGVANDPGGMLPSPILALDTSPANGGRPLGSPVRSGGRNHPSEFAQASLWLAPRIPGAGEIGGVGCGDGWSRAVGP